VRCRSGLAARRARAAPRLPAARDAARAGARGRTPCGRRAPRRPGEVLTDLDRVGNEPVALDDGDVGERCRAGTGPPPKVLPRSPRASASVSRGLATTAPIGRPAASPWRTSARRGSRPPPPRAERPAAADAALHLVEQQDGAALVREAAGGLEELDRAIPRPREALDRLDQHRGHRAVDRRVEGGDVVERTFRLSGTPRGGQPVRSVARRCRRASPPCGRATRLAPRRSSGVRCTAAPDAARSRWPPRRVAEEHRPSGSGQSWASFSASASRCGSGTAVE